MDTESFIIHIKTEDFYEDIDNDVENWFDTSNYDDNRPLPIGMKKEYKDEFRDELGGKIVKEFVTLRAKTCVLSGWWYLTWKSKKEQRNV